MASQPPGGSVLPLLEGVNFCHSYIACEETHSMVVVNIDCIMISLLRALPKPPALSLTLIQQNLKFRSHLVISSSSQLLKTTTFQLSLWTLTQTNCFLSVKNPTLHNKVSSPLCSVSSLNRATRKINSHSILLNPFKPFFLTHPSHLWSQDSLHEWGKSFHNHNKQDPLQGFQTPETKRPVHNWNNSLRTRKRRGFARSKDLYPFARSWELNPIHRRTIWRVIYLSSAFDFSGQDSGTCTTRSRSRLFFIINLHNCLFFCFQFLNLH